MRKHIRAFKQKQGFSLLEISITMMIIVATASGALVFYGDVVERTHLSEAINNLSAIKDAQIMFQYETGAYAANISSLDIDVPDESNKFNVPAGAGDVNGQSCVASITRDGGAYTLGITAAGDFVCTGALCAQLGF